MSVMHAMLACAEVAMLVGLILFVGRMLVDAWTIYWDLHDKG